MRRFQRSACVLWILAILLGAASTGEAAESSPRARKWEPGASELRSDWDQSAGLADQISQMTGVMLTPMLGLGVIGALHWYRASPADRTRLPWHDRPVVFIPMFLVMLVMFAGHRLPVIKHFFKQLKLIENKAAGLLALPVVASGVAAAMAHPIGGAMAELGRTLLPVAFAGTPDASPSSSHLLGAAAGGIAAVLFGAAVWLVGHSVNVLASMSPFSLVDYLLKGLKTAALLVLVLAAKISPGMGAAVAATYILLSLLVAGWAFRLMVFGWVFSLDVLLVRSRKTRDTDEVLAFSAKGFEAVPVRTLGTIVCEGSSRRFVYRPWCVGPKREAPLPSEPLVVVRGVVSPVLLGRGPTERTLFRMPPRFRPHAPALARNWSLPLEEAPVRRGIGAAIGWLRSQLGLSAPGYAAS